MMEYSVSRGVACKVSVVDYSAFVLENLANSALHPIVFQVQEIRFGGASSDPEIQLRIEMQSEPYRGFHVVIHELIIQF